MAEGFPTLEVEPFLVIAETRTYVGAPAERPLLTNALVAVDLVLATTVFHSVLFALASIL